MFYYCYYLHAILLSSSIFVNDSNLNNMNYVVDSYPKNIESSYKNEIVYKKAPTPWRKMLNTK